MSRQVMASRAAIPTGTYIDNLLTAYQLCEVKCMKHKINFDEVLRKAEDMRIITNKDMAYCLDAVLHHEIKLKSLRSTVGGYLQR
jgi:hypothetical protein